MAIDEKRKKEFVKYLVHWEKQNFRPFPWRKDITLYRVFVSEILLKRTTSKAASRVFEQFLELFPDIKSLHKADLNLIEDVLRPLGLYKQRAKGLKATAKYIVEDCGGEFPLKHADLLKVPHIGAYTAGAIQSIGRGIPAPMVDSNVIRVIRRVFGDIIFDNPSPKEVTTIVLELLPEKEHEYFNWGLIDLGALVCTYRGCNSDICPVKDYCNFSNK